MRLIALEEHYRSKQVDAEIGPAGDYYRSMNSAGEKVAQQRLANLTDLGERRIADMDRAGIDLQVLSHTHPSPEILEPSRAEPLCRRVNDEVAEAVARFPGRFAGFAALPVADPTAAARELERTVSQLGFKGALINGMSQGRFLDDQFFTPLLERAEALDVPLYLHPAPPPEAVQKAYFSGLEPGLERILTIAGWGWHAEQGLHTIRLIANGVFERFPKLQIIIGHMGEMIPFYLARVDAVVTPFTKLKRPFADYFHNNIHITTSGIFTRPPFDLALEVVGVDRIMFSIDYPYSPNEAGRAFLDNLCLSQGDFDKITHGNAERLLKL
ncbi:MAG TPA: amidohydrolase family protein [Bryobacteraceae bacterium]|nr:amidohydrolase family protein [Bryobacteraceae bacterium]